MMPVEPAKLSIIHYPEPILRRKAQPVEDVNEEVRAVALRMLELMHEADGVGLAAPQVGLPWRLFVVAAREGDTADHVFINPTLKVTNPAPVAQEEGCLSLPGIHVEVRRAKAVELSAVNLAGEPITVAAEDFLARVWQHEFDHLEGKLIIDRMSPMARLATRRSLKELEAAAR